MKKALLIVSTNLMIGLALLCVLEVILRHFMPVPTLSPRFDVSREYGWIPFADTRMVAERSGKWKFIYTTNQYGCRGREFDPSAPAGSAKIIVLGDSHTFGQGVNDGEEYPAVMQAQLGGRYDVVNLGCPGWGLTHHIRRYFEFGRSYKPKHVILQFCRNDPSDNFRGMRTVVKDGRFIFKDASTKHMRIKKWVSRSALQKSQIYTVFRHKTHQLLFKNDPPPDDRNERKTLAGQDVDTSSIFFNELLVSFAEQVKKDGAQLIMISVNGQLGGFPMIAEQVIELEKAGLIRYLEVSTWFEGLSGFGSPEGHEWGVAAHRIIGINLSTQILALDTIELPSDTADTLAH